MSPEDKLKLAIKAHVNTPLPEQKAKKVRRTFVDDVIASMDVPVPEPMEMPRALKSAG